MDKDSTNQITRNLRNFLGSGSHDLMPHQAEALTAVERFLRTPVGGAILPPEQVHDVPDNLPRKKGQFFQVLSATGSGKTRMFGTMAKAIDVPTLILTPRNVLNDQTRREFCKDVGIPVNQVAVYDSKQSVGERRRVIEGNPPPKFVITSYQSLPALLDRHEFDISNPKDPHYRPLVILDEMHEAQGPKISAALKKLKNNVLLAGFTATDAGAANTLFDGQAPVFRLPLVEAIQHGILCGGVRTGTIDVALDEQWAKEFETRKEGQDYKREDIAKFVRAPSVVEGAINFHLHHDDADLGKISRLPTIFYTEGIEAAEQGAALFNERARQLRLPVKAAHVSSHMRPSQYAPILEQFKRGEIQALWNDSLLGMGFDAKNATVCYSLKPTRLPYIAEQQLGRVTRKGEDDYAQRYGPSKKALAINVRAQGMNPILFGEVMDGRPAVYSEKIERTGSSEGGSSKPSDSEWLHNIKVHIDYNDMHEVLCSASQQRGEKVEIQRSPRAPESWQSAHTLAQSFVGHTQGLNAKLEELREAKRASGVTETELQEKWVGVYSSKMGHEATYASPQAIRELGLKSIDEKAASAPKGWQSGKMLEKVYVGGGTALNAKLKALRESKRAIGLSEAEIQEKWVGSYSPLRGHEATYASPQAIAELGLKAKSEKATRAPEGWQSCSMLAQSYVGDIWVLNAKLERLRETKRAAGVPETEIQEKWIGDYSSKTGNEATYASPQAIAELELKAKSEKAPKASEGWQSGGMLMRSYIGGNIELNAKLKALNDKKRKKGMSEAEIQENWVGIYSPKTGNEGFYASPQAIAELERDGTITPRDAAQSFSEKVGGARSIKPDSQHLKRTGRSREKKE